MTGKGWTWLGSDGAVSSTFTKSQHLQHAMQGMVGFRPKGGSGELYSKILKQWGLRGTRGKVGTNGRIPIENSEIHCIIVKVLCKLLKMSCYRVPLL